jgi:hypothetical protein
VSSEPEGRTILTRNPMSKCNAGCTLPRFFLNSLWGSIDFPNSYRLPVPAASSVKDTSSEAAETLHNVFALCPDGWYQP